MHSERPWIDAEASSCVASPWTRNQTHGYIVISDMHMGVILNSKMLILLYDIICPEEESFCLESHVPQMACK